MSSIAADPRPAALTGATRVGYGTGALGISAVEFFVRVYLLKLYSDTMGLSPVVAGVILALGTLVDAVTDLLMGEVSDRTRLRSGRRRPYIAIGTVLTAATFVLLFAPPAFGSPAALAIYLIVVYLLFTTALTMLAVPHAALGGELTNDPGGRNELFAWRFLFTNLGMLLAIVLPAMLAGKNGSVGAGAVWLAPPILLAGFLAVRATRSQDAPDPSGLRFSFRAFLRSLLAVLRRKAFRPLLAAYLIGSIALTVNSAVALFFYEYRLGLAERDVFLAVLLPFALVIALSVGGWVLISRRLGRRRSAFLGVLLLGIGGSVVVPLLPPGGLLWPVLWAIFGGSLVGSVFLLDATVADVVDLDEAVTGVHREGVYFGMWRMISKVARAIGLLVTGIALDLIGFDSAAPEQTEATVDGLAIILGPVVGVMFIIAALVWLLVPLNAALRERVRRVQARRSVRAAFLSSLSPLP